MPQAWRRLTQRYGEKPASVFYQMDSNEQSSIPLGTGVHQGNALEPVLFCMSVATRLAKVRTQFEPQGNYCRSSPAWTTWEWRFWS